MRPAYKDLNKSLKLCRMASAAAARGDTVADRVLSARQDHYTRRWNTRQAKITGLYFSKGGHK